MKSLISRPVLTLASLLTIAVFTAGAQDLNTAIQFTRSEQYDKADELLKQLIQREPSNSKNYFYLGENYLLEYFSDTISNTFTVAVNNAREAFQKGVDVGPNDPLNYIGLAKIVSYLGDDQKAAEHRAKAKSFLPPVPKNIKKINPPAPQYAFTLAKIAESYIKFDDVDTSLALPLIREAVKIDGKNSDVFLIAGDILILKNDASGAIRYYNLAQMADPKSPTANMKIGNIYVRARTSQSLQTAIPYFEEAIQLDANYAPAYRELGQLYLLAQRFPQAKENFEKYLALTAGNIPARIRYVNALFYARDFDGVIENVEEIFRVDRSRTYMNRIAGYSSFDKTPPDYDKALNYMETLFSTLAADRIIPRDYQYMARILARKNAGVIGLVDNAAAVRTDIGRDQSRLAATRVAAERDAINDEIAKKTATADSLDVIIAGMNKEVDRAFEYYDKFLETRPDDRALLQEITAMYSSFRNYVGVAKTLSLTLGPLPESRDDYMAVGNAYYRAERYQSADSVFNIVLRSSPNYVPAHLLVARTYSRLDPDANLGLAKPKFDKLVEVAQTDSVTYKSELAEGIQFLSYYYYSSGNYTQARAYYNRLAAIDPNNNDYKIRAYNGIGLIEQRLVGNETTNEGRLAVIARSVEAFNRILALDPNNTSAKSQIDYLRNYEASVRRGINPNEIRGVITDAATNAPIAFVSIRVKDTAAENLTNQRGEFRFEIPSSGEALIISARDYRTIEVPITSSRVYNLALSK